MIADDRPFATRLEELKRCHGLSFRALAIRLQACAEPGERGMTSGHLAGLATGQRAATPEVIALVARAFELAPESFVEWRLWQAQQLFDPRRDGLGAAVDALHSLHAFIASATDAATPIVPGSRESRRHVRAALSAKS